MPQRSGMRDQTSNTPPLSVQQRQLGISMPETEKAAQQHDSQTQQQVTKIPSAPRQHTDLTPPKLHTIWTSALNEAPSGRVTSLKLLGRSIHEHNRHNKSANSILPPQYQVHFQIDLGLSYAFLGEHKMAWASFESALSYDEGNCIALFCYGLAKAEVGLWDEAIAPWRRCLANFDVLKADALHFPIFQFKYMQDFGLGNEWTLVRAVVQQNLEVALNAQGGLSLDGQRKAQGHERRGLYGIPAGVQLGPIWNPQLEQFEEKAWAVKTTIQQESESSLSRQPTAPTYEYSSPPQMRRVSKPLPPLPTSPAKSAMREELEMVGAKMKVSKLAYYWDVSNNQPALLDVPNPIPPIQPSPVISDHQTPHADNKDHARDQSTPLVPSPLPTPHNQPCAPATINDHDPEPQPSFRQSQISDVEDLIEIWDADVQKSIQTPSKLNAILETQLAAYNHDYEGIEEYNDNTAMRYLSMITAKDSLENTDGIIDELRSRIKSAPKSRHRMHDLRNADAERAMDEEEIITLPPRAYSGYRFPTSTIPTTAPQAHEPIPTIPNNDADADADADNDSDTSTIIGDADSPHPSKHFSALASPRPRTPHAHATYTLVDELAPPLVFQRRGSNGVLRGFDARGREMLLPRAFEGFRGDVERRGRADAVREREMGKV